MRYHLFFLSTMCLIILTLAIIMRQIIMPLKGQPIASFEPLEAKYQVGKPYPADSVCNWTPSSGAELYCNAIDDSGKYVWLSYDTALDKINFSAVEVRGKTIGDLILAWGMPQGINQADYGIYVYWQGRYAYSVDNVFGPASPVGFVAYQLEEVRKQPWKGFISKQNAD